MVKNTDNISTELPDTQQSDICRKMEAILNKRNKIIHHKDNVLPCAVVVDAMNIPDTLRNDDSPQVQVQPHKHLHACSQSLETFIQNVQMLKQTSEIEINFVENELTEKNQILQAISRIRKQSEKVLKEIINTQVDFNEHLNNKLLAHGSEHREQIKKHERLIMDTCKFDRGIESLIQCDMNRLGAYAKDTEIKDADEFKSAYEDLAQGMLSEIYKTGENTYSNHEHLLAIKKYNKTLLTDGMTVEVMSGVKLDPFTKEPITNPVHNKVCKHVYDQISIDKMFQNKLIISCPYIGCANKNFTKKDLLNDTVVSDVDV